MKSIFVFLVVTLFFTLPQASANIGEAYGFGSRTAALGAATVAGMPDAYSAYTNPAALPHSQKRLVISWSLMDMEMRFLPIRDIVLTNLYTSDETKTGDVDQSYRSSFGQTLGLSYVLFPNQHQLSLGAVVFIPTSQIAYMDTGETFIPEYVLYRDRTQRPQFEFGLGAEVNQYLSVGAGVHLAFSLTTNASVFLQSDDKKASTMRFATSLKPKVSPYFGLLFSKPTATPQEQPDYSVGLVVRLAAKSDNDMTLNSNANVILGTAVPFNFTSASAIFYDPLSFEVGMTLRYWERARLYLQGDYQVWSDFVAPAIAIAKPSVEQGSVNIASGKNPQFAYQDIFIPRIGHELDLYEGGTLRLSYAYRPSIFKDVPNDIGNYLDPAKHMINMGLGFKFERFLGVDVATQLDLHASYQQLVTQTIVKTPGNELNNPAASKIGSPGYKAGGKLFGGGVSLTVGF